MQVLLSQDEIRKRIEALASEISADYPTDDEIHLVCVLKGGFVFLSDLVRSLKVRVTLDFIALSSYGRGTKSSGEVRLIKDVDHALEDRHVIIVEDIVDTGLTLHYLQEILRARSPKSLRTACLLSKPSRGVRRVHHRRPLRCRLRPRLRRALPRAAVHCCPDRVRRLGARDWIQRDSMTGR